MKVLAFLVTFLLVQSISASFINEHARTQPVVRFPIDQGQYVISNSTVKGTRGTHVNFDKGSIIFYRGCNRHWNSYESDGHHFSVGKHWAATRRGCRKVQHQLDNAVVQLFDEATNTRSSHPSTVKFYHGSKWLFTLTRKK